MTMDEAMTAYSQALAAYFDPWTGHGSRGRHAHGNELAYGQHAQAKARALAAPDRAEQAIRAAGLDFETVWLAVHGREFAPEGGTLHGA